MFGGIRRMAGIYMFMKVLAPCPSRVLILVGRKNYVRPLCSVFQREVFHNKQEIESAYINIFVSFSGVLSYIADINSIRPG